LGFFVVLVFSFVAAFDSLFITPVYVFVSTSSVRFGFLPGLYC
jgi:hypothetical protein